MLNKSMLTQSFLEITEEGFEVELDKKKSWMEFEKVKEFVKPEEAQEWFMMKNISWGGVPFVDLILLNALNSYVEFKLHSLGTIIKEFCFTRQTILMREEFSYFGQKLNVDL